ncbi:DUF2169 domain-containing protein [Acidisphaera sp. L21]|uniref:DUF2169 domain-containing protein n=1 Tax=Acidisphaera sp. L21 TaxID=1641851 RepID=UPI00131D0406|nr:DUF2169 domain-containing protein [Acidisphaera sp. L21]
MRLLHHGNEPAHTDLAWYFRTMPAAHRTCQLVVCGSMLVSHSNEAPVRVDSEHSAGYRAAPYKVAGDLLVSGRAWPAGGGLASGVRVAVTIGAWRKELAVFGDRIWEMGVSGMASTRPLPFQSMPITYDRAFGGLGNKWNPTGLGMGHGDRSIRLPNVEALDRLISQPTARPEPAGFGPIDPFWRPRSDRFGTFNADWLSTEWPGMPADFDLRHWNQAPQDQQFSGWFRGDEQISVYNMHPDQPRLDIALPGRRARAFIAGVDGEFGEINLRLDTIAVDMEAGYTELTWRGAIPVRTPRLRDLAFLFTTAEDFAAPLTAETCRDAFERTRREVYPTPEEHAVDMAETRDSREAEQQRRQAADAAERRRMLARADAMITTAAREADEQTKEHGGPAAAPTSAMETTIASVREHDADKAEELEAAWQDAQANIPGPTQRWTRERVIAAHAAGEAMSNATLAGLDLSALVLDGAVLSGADLSSATLVGSSLRGANLGSANLSMADATDVDFHAANLTSVSLTGMTATGASFAAADMAGANLSGMHAAGARFDGAQGSRADFACADLTGASFAGTYLPGANFSDALLSDAIFDDATLTEADLGGATAIRASFIDADMVNLRAAGTDLRNAVLTRAHAPRSIWQRARLDGADLSRAVLNWAIFAEASLDGAKFDRAWLEDSKFDEASLRGAHLTRAKMVRASLEWTDLTDADLSGSNLYNAGLYNADCTRLRYDGCYLTGTLLAPTPLTS